MITSNKNYFISCLFFLFFFIGWGCCYPYLSLWLTETIGINYTDVGLVYSFTAIVAVCVQPLFGFISDKLVGNDSNLLIVFYVQIVPDDFVMQLHRF